MTWRTMLLVASLVGVVLWLLIYLLAVTSYRAVHESTPPDPRYLAASAAEAFVVDMDGMPTTTTVAPTTTTTARARTSTTVRVSRPTPAYVGSIPDLIRRVFARFGPVVADEAVRVSFCESRHDPRATNGQHASLFQVSRTYHEGRARRLGFTWEQMWDPEVNSLVAADLYAEQGWKPWECRYAA